MNTIYAIVNSWDFSTSADYIFDNTKIEFSSGEAQLKATSNWYSPSWSRRKAIGIDNSNNSDTLSDYQVQVIVPYDPAMQTDFDDIRFADADGTTLLNYYRESYTSASTASFWVKVPTLNGSATKTLYLYYGHAQASSLSSGSDTFIVFDDFNNGQNHLLPWGSDTSNSSGFDPVSRRFYRFPLDNGGGATINITQWVNIDTWEVGFVYPSMPIAANGASVIYHPTKKKFYIYGGRTASNVFSDKIIAFDPATETYEVLSETLLQGAGLLGAVLEPTSGKVYLFGGLTSTTPAYVYTHSITVHNLDFITPTVTDTGAHLAVASNGMEPVYATSDNKIYLLGGAYAASGSDIDSLDSIYAYNPASPGTDPVDTGVKLATEMDTTAPVYLNGSIYIFGGYRFSEPVGYYNLIQKFNIAPLSIFTLTETLHKSDDDMKGFYDSINNKIYVGAALHSAGLQNENARKVVLLEFDPDTETLVAEPTLGTVPAGWTSAGTNTGVYSDPKDIGGQLVLVDTSNSQYVSAKRTFSALSGTVMAEFRVSIPNASGSERFTIGQESGNVAAEIRNGTEAAWKIYDSTEHTFASFPTGTSWQILGMLIDTSTQKQYGVLNRGALSPAYVWLNSDVILNMVTLSTSTSGGNEAVALDWFWVRNSTTGTEPVASLGSEETLYDTSHPSVEPQPSTAKDFSSISGFSETATKDGGQIKYQISGDAGTSWYWYNSGWTLTTSGYAEANLASDINSNISTFPISPGSFLFKAYLNSDGAQFVQLDSVDLTYVAWETNKKVFIPLLILSPLGPN